MRAHYVKRYVKRNKTDGRDAEAICEAMSGRTMRFVSVKGEDAQAVLAMHGRVRCWCASARCGECAASDACGVRDSGGARQCGSAHADGAGGVQKCRSRRGASGIVVVGSAMGASGYGGARARPADSAGGAGAGGSATTDGYARRRYARGDGCSRQGGGRERVRLGARFCGLARSHAAAERNGGKQRSAESPNRETGRCANCSSWARGRGSTRCGCAGRRMAGCSICWRAEQAR